MDKKSHLIVREKSRSIAIGNWRCRGQRRLKNES